MAERGDLPAHEPPPTETRRWSWLKKFTGRQPAQPASTVSPQAFRSASPTLSDIDASQASVTSPRSSRRVVAGLPRAKTFKRQVSEDREKLEADEPEKVERRTLSVDRKPRPLSHGPRRRQPLPRASAPDFLENHTPSPPETSLGAASTLVGANARSSLGGADFEHRHDDASGYLTAPPSAVDTQSVTTSQYDLMLNLDLEQKWILNLSMHFRDKSKREKFFVTYREKESLWRRVTISLDYRNAPDDSLEKDLSSLEYQRDKSSKIYEAIRESLSDIQFYSTVTNLKLQTTNGRLHVHVVEDVNEIIHYPVVRAVQHLRCRHVRESELTFDSHMSGFVYKVKVHGRTLIKKEIPGPDTVDEFLYEVNALESLRFSSSVIEFYGLVVDDHSQHVKGLLISYAERGALIDIIYESQERGEELPWATRKKWARQIVQGLSDIHEAGFVQGDFTLSNIVIDANGNAKIIDINRRGCPVGWEPPEATPLIESNQRIHMYIGVKSDLFQLGMVLWALATLEDEPEAHPRPLRLDRDIELPGWYRTMVQNCLSENPRVRLAATALVAMFPDPDRTPPSISVEDEFSVQEYVVKEYPGNLHPQICNVQPRYDYSDEDLGADYYSDDGSSYYPPRGRSPPSPLPSNHGRYDTPFVERHFSWSDKIPAPPSLSDFGPSETRVDTPMDSQEVVMPEMGYASTTAGKPTVREPEAAAQTEAPAPTTAELGSGSGATTPGAGKATLATERLESSLMEDKTPAEPAQTQNGPEDVIRQAPTILEKTTDTEPMNDMDQPKPDVAPTIHLNETNGAAEDRTQTGGAPKNGTNDGDHYEVNGHTSKEPEDQAGLSEPLLADAVESTQPRRDHSNDLSGIGSAYSAQDEVRQPMCSDEDLGIEIAVQQNASSSL